MDQEELALETFLVTLEYADLLAALWAAGFDDAKVSDIHGHHMITFAMPGTDGFFLIGGTDGNMPLSRDDLPGWEFVAYMPPADDPDRRLDLGAVLLITEDDDYGPMVSTVAPTARLIAAAVVNGRSA